MGGSDIIILAVIAVLVVIIAVRYVKRVSAGKSNCGCGGEGDGHRAVAQVAVADTDEAHYPYELDLMVGGMSCDGCVANVENALNALDGIWATAALSGDVHVRGKQPIDEGSLEAAVKEAGYYVKKL